MLLEPLPFPHFERLYMVWARSDAQGNDHIRASGRSDHLVPDLDRFLEFYDHQRSHRGYRLSGRTPAQALREALGRPELPPLYLELLEGAAQHSDAA